MAREIDINYPDGATLYAIIRRVSDSKVVTQSDLSIDTWADGSIANYDFPLTSRGGDYYAIDFPALALGAYRVTYYERAGVTPAITDLALKSEVINWTGSAVTTSLSTDLTTLAKVKSYMNITATTWDTMLETLITNVSLGLTKWCGRDSFLVADYTSVLNGNGKRWYQLPNIPVNTLTSIIFDYNETTTTTVLGAEFDIEDSTGYIRFKPTSTSTRMFTAGFRNLYVTYNAGYATVPGDLELAATIAVSTSFDMSQQTSGLQSERIGDYAYQMVNNFQAGMAASDPAYDSARQLLYSGGYKALAFS